MVSVPVTEVLQSLARNEDGDWSEADAESVVHTLGLFDHTLCGEPIGTEATGWRPVRYRITCRDCLRMID